MFDGAFGYRYEIDYVDDCNCCTFRSRLQIRNAGTTRLVPLVMQYIYM